MIVAAKTHVGIVRASNQDALLLGDGFYGVADGMGGHKGGEVASGLAVEWMEGLLKAAPPSLETLETAIQKVNTDLFAKQEADASLTGMGTTLTVLWSNDNQMHIGHVGDSRAYLLRDGKLAQVTKDHSVVGEMMRQGLLTKEKARVHPYRNVITRAVGTAPDIEVDIFTLEKAPGDLWLICSDGLNTMLEDEEIAVHLAQEQLETALENLLEAALAKGGRDNISIVLLRDEEVAS